MTKAIRIHASGGPDVLQLDEVDLPEPGPGEARVRHTAIGLNFIDTYHRTGLYPVALPSGIGVEGAGVVEAVGKGVEGLAVGDRVAYAGRPPGSYAEARNIEARLLVPIPKGVSDDVAAAVMLKGMTSEYLIRRTFRVEAGHTVLLHAAAGGVGTLASQWMAHRGATVIGTVGTQVKAERARAHGCTHAIVYTKEDFVERVRELTGGNGVDVVYDSVGKATFHRSLQCLKRRGMAVSFGNASGKPDPLDVLELSRRGSLYVTRPTLFDYIATREELEASAAAVFDVVGRAAVKVEIGQEFALGDAAEAHRALEGRKTVGATLLRP